MVFFNALTSPLAIFFVSCYKKMPAAKSFGRVESFQRRYRRQKSSSAFMNFSCLSSSSLTTWRHDQPKRKTKKVRQTNPANIIQLLGVI
jgi:hypothetical protein